MLTRSLGTLRGTRSLHCVLGHLWQDGEAGGERWEGMCLLSQAGLEEELSLSCWARAGSPQGFSSLFMEAPGPGSSLLLEAPLNADTVECSDTINKCNSSHRENLVFTVNSASTRRHRSVFCSLTPLVIVTGFPGALRCLFYRVAAGQGMWHRAGEWVLGNPLVACTEGGSCWFDVLLEADGFDTGRFLSFSSQGFFHVKM